MLNSKPADLSNINSRRISAVEYADKYCGAAASEEYRYSYNKKYKDYNPLGGDCANFASQILHEGEGLKRIIPGSTKRRKQSLGKCTSF